MIYTAHKNTLTVEINCGRSRKLNECRKEVRELRRATSLKKGNATINFVCILLSEVRGFQSPLILKTEREICSFFQLSIDNNRTSKVVNQHVFESRGL
jgi:hypothetical protein